MKLEYDSLHMAECLRLAQERLGYVAPNPMVGAVIARGSEVIATGVHRHFGANHAEVEAINKIPSDLNRAELTLYVNLEPCCHFGKTPPCTQAIIASGIKRVVVACVDPFKEVSGGGIKQLRDANLNVTLGVLEKEAKDLNKRFFCFHQEKRPYIILKWAETSDHFIAKPDGNSKWISCWESRRLTHKWRSQEDAILVGTQTALIDNPQLDVRHTSGPNPLRLVIDKQLSLSKQAHLLDQSLRTIVFNLIQDSKQKNLEYRKLDRARSFLTQIMSDLFDRKVQSLLVEGGAALHRSLLEMDLWDEIRVFRSEEEFKEGLSAPHLPDQLADIGVVEQKVGTDLLTILTKTH